MLPLASLLLILAAPATAGPPLSLPPSWESRTVYYQSFDAPGAGPDVCAPGIEAASAAAGSAAGVRGRCSVPKEITLRGAALSPHRPLTISFWWALTADATKDTGFGLATLQGRGMVSLFARSGPWCGLTRTAGVLQVYYLSGIQNVNGIYDTALSDHLMLKAGVWHHSALVISAASLVTAYTDGKKVYETRLLGRPFNEQDGFNSLTLGGDGVLLDEIAVLNRPLTADEIGDYVTAIGQMRAAGYPVR